MQGNTYCALTVSGDGGLSIHGKGDEQFYGGEWRIDFFDGFDKSLWLQLNDTFEEVSAEEMVAKDPVYTIQTHSNGIVVDQEVPCGMIWEQDVYFNMTSPSEHTLWCAGGMYDLEWDTPAHQGWQGECDHRVPREWCHQAGYECAEET